MASLLCILFGCCTACSLTRFELRDKSILRGRTGRWPQRRDMPETRPPDARDQRQGRSMFSRIDEAFLATGSRAVGAPPMAGSRRT